MKSREVCRCNNASSSELTEGPGRLLYFVRGDVRWTADGGHLVLGVCEIFLAR